MTGADRNPLVRGLLDPAAYPHPTGTIKLVETHISWVFLTGPFAYKVKKPVNLGFLDFTSPDRRRELCAEEIRVSGRFAPEIYVGASAITGTPRAPRVDGPGVAFEWAVKLVQFDEADRLDNLFEAGRLSAADCERLGADIAATEERLAVATAADGWGTPRTVRDAAAILLEQIRTLRPDARQRADRIACWLEAELTAAASVIARRIAAGRVRECHGDLHLSNIVLHSGRMMAFDAIEFSPQLRWIDVANDVAFLAMDLESRGRRDLAAHAVSGWIEAADDHDATRVLRIYEVYRAVVRAAVSALRGDADDAPGSSRALTDRYLDLAERLMVPPRPALYATSGVSGSGKTTLAAAVVGAAGAVRLRSDVERKRGAGMAATDRPADEAHARALYGEAATRQVYQRLATLARTMLGAGTSVVVDAACNRRWQRDLVAGAAREAGAPVVWLDFDLPADAVLARVAARAAAGRDASDASEDVVRAQWNAREPITAAEVEADTSAGVPARWVRVTPRELDDEGFAARVAGGA
jgi:aminoglycoside phosphotransferase family enzyme/predicted kinase